MRPMGVHFAEISRCRIIFKKLHCIPIVRDAATNDLLYLQRYSYFYWFFFTNLFSLIFSALIIKGGPSWSKASNDHKKLWAALLEGLQRQKESGAHATLQTLLPSAYSDMLDNILPTEALPDCLYNCINYASTELFTNIKLSVVSQPFVHSYFKI
jgi:hypothetical protein